MGSTTILYMAHYCFDRFSSWSNVSNDATCVRKLVEKGCYEHFRRRFYIKQSDKSSQYRVNSYFIIKLVFLLLRVTNCISMMYVKI